MPVEDKSRFSVQNQNDIQTDPSAHVTDFADVTMERYLDLNSLMVRNKPSTFFFRMKGDAMREAGIFDNDILIVDRGIKVANGKVVVVVLNGELLVRRFHKNFSSTFLIPENTRFKTINLAEFSDLVMWGVVTFVVHQL